MTFFADNGSKLDPAPARLSDGPLDLAVLLKIATYTRALFLSESMRLRLAPRAELQAVIAANEFKVVADTGRAQATKWKAPALQGRCSTKAVMRPTVTALGEFSATEPLKMACRRRRPLWEYDRDLTFELHNALHGGTVGVQGTCK